MSSSTLGRMRQTEEACDQPKPRPLEAQYALTWRAQLPHRMGCCTPETETKESILDEYVTPY